MAKSQESGYWVCLSDQHKAVLEIIKDEDFEKYEESEGGYVKLKYTQTKDEAVELIRTMLANVWEEDPSMTDIKKVLKRLYA
jgi:hypothetical protein